jgi:hypothetical protein
MLQRVDRFEDESGREIFRSPYFTDEPPPTPRQIFGQVAFVLFVFLYMSAILTLLAHVLAR